MQPVQDLTIDSTIGRGQYLFLLENPNAAEFTTWVPRLVDRLADAYERTSSDEWRWFEDELSYDNARLPQALLMGGSALWVSLPWRIKSSKVRRSKY